jgi:hypothetical protein
MLKDLIDLIDDTVYSYNTLTSEKVEEITSYLKKLDLDTNTINNILNFVDDIVYCNDTLQDESILELKEMLKC